MYNGTKEEPPPAAAAAHRCRVTLIIFYICISGRKWRPEKPPRNNGGGNNRIRGTAVRELCTALHPPPWVVSCVCVWAFVFFRYPEGWASCDNRREKGAETDPARCNYDDNPKTISLRRKSSRHHVHRITTHINYTNRIWYRTRTQQTRSKTTIDKSHNIIILYVSIIFVHDSIHVQSTLGT